MPISTSLPKTVRAISVLIISTITGCGPAKNEKTEVRKVSFSGYTLVQQLSSRATNLIDSQGRTVHRWLSDYRLGGGTYLMENGSLLRSSIPATTVQEGITPGLTGMVELLDWEGRRLWSYTLAEPKRSLHHDIEPLPNGNILMLAVEELSPAEQIGLGRDPARATAELKLDYLIEMRPEGTEGGRIVWEWHMKDHLVQDFDKTKKNYGVVSDRPERLDINFVENIRKGNSASGLRVMQSLGYVSSTAKITPQRVMPDWTHSNAVAYHAGHDQILISIRSIGEVWVIDHGTTTEEAATSAGGRMKKGGGILYRWGNPQAYQSGTPEDQQLFGQHDAQWIPEGRPGAGRILIFNNGEGRRDGEYSSVEEIEPPVRPDGSYERSEGAAFGPVKAAWRYAAAKKDEFYSSFLSGVERLPDGNTLICSGAQGRMFEVTAIGEIVWEQKMDITIRGPRSEGARWPDPGGRPGMMRGPGNRPPGAGGETAGAGGLTEAEMAVLNGRPVPPPGGFGGGKRGFPGRAGKGGPGGPGGPAGSGGGLFRARRYGEDYPAFKGKTLQPLPTQAGPPGGTPPAPPASPVPARQ